MRPEPLIASSVWTQILHNDCVELCIDAMSPGVNLTMPSQVHEPDVSRLSLTFVVPLMISSPSKLEMITLSSLMMNCPLGGGKPGSTRSAVRNGDCTKSVLARLVLPLNHTMAP